MESIESKLFDLLERHSFDQLDDMQKNFVLLHMTEDEYRSQQNVMKNSGLIDYPEVTPLPLNLEKKSASGILIPIPLYKVLLGAAATFIGVWFFWPKEISLDSNLSVQTKTIRDTVYVSKIQHDTIRIYSEKAPIAKNVKTVDTVYIYQTKNDPAISQRMLEPGINQTSLVLNESKLKTKGNPIRDDETMNLLPTVQAFGL